MNLSRWYALGNPMQDMNRRLEALARYGILDTPPEPEFDDIVQIARRVCGTPVALVSLVDADRQWFKARAGFPACETPLAQSVCVHALTANGVFVIPDLASDTRTASNPLVLEEPFIRFYAGVPLQTPDGVAIGSLCVIDTKPRPDGLSPDQSDILLMLARQRMTMMGLRKGVTTRDEALEATFARAIRSEAASDRLREAEARVRGAQEAARIGAFEVDIAADRFQGSAEFCRIFGLPQKEFFDASTIEDLVLLQDRGAKASSRSTRQDASAQQDVEYRIRRKSDGALRWISRKSSFIWDETGEPLRMLGVVQDVTERKLADLKSHALVMLGDQLRSAQTRLKVGEIASHLLGETLAASRAGYGIVNEAEATYTVDCDWVAPGMTSIAGTWPIEPFQTTIGILTNGAPLTVANVVAAPWLGTDHAAYAATMVAAQIAIPLIDDDRLVGVLFVHNHIPRTWTTAEVAFAVSVADRAYAAIAKIEAEEHQRVLNEELSHRLKNTLSMVQAIAAQTLRHVADRSVVRALDDRIIALSKAHDVLLQRSWTAAPVAMVVAGVLGLHARADHFDIVGPPIMMGSKATLSLSLLLHELTTNSIKYGALSVAAGRVGMEWRIDREGSEPVFVLAWTETGGPPAKPPTRRGFGSRLIGLGLAGAGNADLDYGETGLQARFRAPLRSITSN